MGKHKHRKHSRDKEDRKKEKKHKKRRKSSSSSDSEEWVEKVLTPQETATPHNFDYSPGQNSKQVDDHEAQKRDEWMNISTKFSSTSTLDRQQEREKQKQIQRDQAIYNPRTCGRELNPYWRDGGDGLPKFQKPTELCNTPIPQVSKSSYPLKRQGWKKQADIVIKDSTEGQSNKYLGTDKPEESKQTVASTDLNMLASKLVKAEIMGNLELVKQLKQRLDVARQMKECNSNNHHEEVILTSTDSKGYTKPVQGPSSEGMPSGSRQRKRKVETHTGGERVRYFADDDKYSLKEMFEHEKSVSTEDQNRDFIQMAGKMRKNDDLDDIFEDKIRHQSDVEAHRVNKAVSEHQKLARSLDSCTKCLQSDNMMKNLMISMGETVYLSVPHHEPLTTGHCLLTPIRHVPCATQLDENEWQELMTFRKALTRMFNSVNQTVIFFETAKNLNRLPHMSIECIPIPLEQGDLAPIYFKKAIDESEYEWSQNKKLVSLKGRNVQNAIPKGLPYFSVSFDMEEGFAHVIEEEKYFPQNFAQEILGGMLDLDHSKWRKPKKLNFNDQKNQVIAFTKLWSDYDNTRHMNITTSCC